MFEENVEVVRRWIAALNAADIAALPGLAHPEIEWRDQMHAPDVPELLRGIAALEHLAWQWEEAYDSLTCEVLDYIDADPWVICDARWRARGRGSGMEVEVRSADAYEVEGDRVRRSWGGYPDSQTARDALGLEE
jgi:ketosteroid isomerase-like protein